MGPKPEPLWRPKGPYGALSARARTPMGPGQNAYGALGGHWGPLCLGHSPYGALKAQMGRGPRADARNTRVTDP
jgi:hypothetical protein